MPSFGIEQQKRGEFVQKRGALRSLFQRERRHAWLRSKLWRAGLAGLVVALVLLLVRLSSYERALLIEINAIEASLTELANEHPRAHLLDIPVYFLNADADERRRTAIMERLARLRPPSVQRVPCVDGRLHLDADRTHGGFAAQTAGELGRTLSHLAAARQLVLDGHEAALIVEDTAHFGAAPRWPFRLSELIAQLPPGWTTLQLFHLLDERFAPQPDAAHAALTLMPSSGPQMAGTVAYVLSRRGADALMQLTRGGRTLRRVALGTRDGRADAVILEFPHSAAWAVWPRLVFAHSSTDRTSARHALRQAKIARAIIEHAQRAWPRRRLGPAPDDIDYPDDVDDNDALMVWGDVID